MKCPSTPAWTAAGMRITTLATSSCDKVLGEMKARVDGQSRSVLNAWQDPRGSGWYTEEDYAQGQFGNSFSTSRSTGDGEYIDRQIFTLKPQWLVPNVKAGCKIYACSRSQVRSFSDNGTNYCNLKMLFCGTADGCKPIKHDLDFSQGESTQKFSQASVDLKKCFGATEEAIVEQAGPTEAREPVGEATTKTRGQPAQEKGDVDEAGTESESGPGEDEAWESVPQPEAAVVVQDSSSEPATDDWESASESDPAEGQSTPESPETVRKNVVV